MLSYYRLIPHVKWFPTCKRTENKQKHTWYWYCLWHLSISSCLSQNFCSAITFRPVTVAMGAALIPLTPAGGPWCGCSVSAPLARGLGGRGLWARGLWGWWWWWRIFLSRAGRENPRVFEPLWKMMEFVNWDDNRNPILMGKCKIHGNQTTNQIPSNSWMEVDWNNFKIGRLDKTTPGNWPPPNAPMRGQPWAVLAWPVLGDTRSGGNKCGFLVNSDEYGLMVSLNHDS